MTGTIFEILKIFNPRAQYWFSKFSSYRVYFLILMASTDFWNSPYRIPNPHTRYWLLKFSIYRVYCNLDTLYVHVYGSKIMLHPMSLMRLSNGSTKIFFPSTVVAGSVTHLILQICGLWITQCGNGYRTVSIKKNVRLFWIYVLH